MNENIGRIIKYAVIFTVLGLGYWQATARAENIGIARANLEAAERQDSIVAEYELAAEIVTATAKSATIEAAVQARADSLEIAEIQRDLTALTERADSVGADLASQLTVINPNLAAEFEEFRTLADSTLTVSKEEIQIEREAKEAANVSALLWQRSSESKDLIIEGQMSQIFSLELAAAAAFEAASPGLWPRIQVDWWVGAIGFGLGILVTR